jgi:hypothetical protein
MRNYAHDGFSTILAGLPAGDLQPLWRLAFWFLYLVVVSFFAGYVACHALPGGAGYTRVFRFAGVTSFLGYAAARRNTESAFGRPPCFLGRLPDNAGGHNNQTPTRRSLFSDVGAAVGADFGVGEYQLLVGLLQQGLGVHRVRLPGPIHRQGNGDFGQSPSGRL